MAQPRSSEATALRKTATEAAMRYGSFETIGNVNLVVLRGDGLLITYSTPFNPLPRPADEGRQARRLEYSLQIWQAGRGKVFSVGWDLAGVVTVHIHRSGSWKAALRKITSGHPAAEPRRTEPRQHHGNKAPAARASV